MEAIGAIASIIGIVGAGAKLSIMLFEFASTVGMAGQEVRQFGIEISTFCSALKQLQSSLTKAKAYRYSLSAIETTQEILDQCQEIFREIEAIVVSLDLRKRSVERSAEATRKLINRVKWTFKRSQVQLLRTTLESCKVTLLIMLSTLDFAQKIATRRVSTLETEAEDKRDETMTRSLIIAHQCTIDTLRRLEEEVQQQPKEDDLISPQLTPGTPLPGRVIRAPAGHKTSRSFNNQNNWFLSPAKDLTSKRASVWINNLIFDNSPLPLEFRRQTWCDVECALFLDQQPYYFIEKWTDQGEHLNKLRRKSIEYPERHDIQEASTNRKEEETTLVPAELLLNSATTSQTEYQQQKLQISSLNLGSIPESSSTQSIPHGTDPDPDTRNPTENQLSAVMKYNREGPLGIGNELRWPLLSKESKRSGNFLHLSETSDVIPSIDYEHFKSFGITMETPCYKVVTAVLKKYNINDPWERYGLFIVHDNKERRVWMHEKPLMIYKQLQIKKGGKPMFRLRKIYNAMVDTSVI